MDKKDVILMTNNPYIEPTVGRVLWYYPGKNDDIPHSGQPLAATIVYVTCDIRINLVVFDMYGNAHSRIDVYLLQRNQRPIEGSSYAAWLTYQKEKVVKHRIKLKNNQ